MNHWKRTVLLGALVDKLRQKGSWCGETHVQKSTFFLQELLGVRLGFRFILYWYGPFSFELREEITGARADGFLDLEAQEPPYGPKLTVTPVYESFHKRFPRTLQRYGSHLDFIATTFGDKGVAELERLATAFYVMHRESMEDVDQVATRVVELKSHIDRTDARDAALEVQDIQRRSQQVA